MRLGDSYRWPDGTIVTLDSLTMTGSFNASYEWPEERGENRRALVTIPACDLYVLLSKGLVRPVPAEDEDE
jgi:hypothetical protein